MKIMIRLGMLMFALVLWSACSNELTPSPPTTPETNVGISTNPGEVEEPTDTTDEENTADIETDAPEGDQDTKKDVEKKRLPIEIMTKPQLASGIVGKSYSNVVISAKGGSGMYVWHVTGDIPPGLETFTCGKKSCQDVQFVSKTFALSGNPKEEGTYTFTCTVSDADGSGLPAQKEFAIAIAPKKETTWTFSELSAKVSDLFVSKLNLNAASKLPVIGILDIDADGNVKKSVQIELRASGGALGYQWQHEEDRPEGKTSKPNFFFPGEGTLLPDAKDPSKATLRVTKVFPIVDPSSGQVFIPIFMFVTDSKGAVAHKALHINVPYPKDDSVNSLKVLSLVEGVEQIFENILGPKSKPTPEFSLANDVWVSFFKGDDELAFWFNWSPPRLTFNRNMESVALTPIFAITGIRFMDGRACGNATAPCDGTVCATISDGPCEGRAVSVIKVQSKYWEAIYNHNYNVQEYIKDAIPLMEGYQEGKPDSIWHPRTDILPRRSN